MKLRTLKAHFAVEFLDLPLAAQVDGAQWEPFQIRLLNNESRFGIDVKSRQIAWSFACAVDAVSDSCVDPGWPHIFVSINREETYEKIRYAKNIIAAIDEPARPVIVRDSLTGLEFANGSRLISYPCRPVRGPAGGRIYLDEMAHYMLGRDRQIYSAALPATTKADGYIRIGSSTLGASGLFWEIARQELRPWPGFDNNRRVIPWWAIRSFCQDVKAARLVAPKMPTEERVRALGTPAIVEIFENMFLEDFQQEYECAWVDESVAWITWDIIKRNQAAHDGLWFHASGVDNALALIPQIQQAIKQRKIEPVLTGGIDIGRKRHLTEFVALGMGTGNQMPVRLVVSLDRVEYDEQQRCFHEFITRLPFSSVLIDQNGIGAHLAENLQRTGRATGVDFTNPSKELWAVGGRVEAERVNTPLPPSRSLAYQIHSIKKKVTAAKHNVFDTERNEKHHADKFWAWALAIHGAVGQYQSVTVHDDSIRVRVGY